MGSAHLTTSDPFLVMLFLYFLRSAVMDLTQFFDDRIIQSSISRSCINLDSPLAIFLELVSTKMFLQEHFDSQMGMLLGWAFNRGFGEK